MLIFFALCVCTSLAHIELVWPKPREGESCKSNCTNKFPYPCGDIGFFAAGSPVTDLPVGPVAIRILEYIYHAGAPLRIALSMGNDDGYDDHVLLAHVPHNDAAATNKDVVMSVVVDIPNVKCDRCSLQVLSIMTDKISPNACCEYPSSAAYKCLSVYHTCANVRINGTSATLSPSTLKDPKVTKMWANREAYNAAWTRYNDTFFSLDKQYPSFLPTRCSCNSTACSQTGPVGPLVTPLTIPTTTTSSSRLTTTRTTTSTAESKQTTTTTSATSNGTTTVTEITSATTDVSPTTLSTSTDASSSTTTTTSDATTTSSRTTSSDATSTTMTSTVVTDVSTATLSDASLRSVVLSIGIVALAPLIAL